MSTHSDPNLIMDAPRRLRMDEGGSIWILDNAILLQARLCVVAHAGSAGHRGIDTTFNILSKYVIWRTIGADVKSFVNKCLHCLVANEQKCPRPYGETLHATKPNEVLHFDFLSMPKRLQVFKYVPVSKDDMSGFCEFFPQQWWISRCCSSIDGLVQAIWCSLLMGFGSRMAFWKCRYEGASQSFGCPTSFCYGLCPWENGTVEVVNRKLLKVMRSLLSEQKQRIINGPSLLPLCQSTLNQLPSRRLGWIAPVTAFAALPQQDPVSVLYQPSVLQGISAFTEHELSAVQCRNMSELQGTLDGMHKQSSEAFRKKNVSARRRNAQKHGVSLVNFRIGDFVLSVSVKRRDKKPMSHWTSPYRVVALNGWTYDVHELVKPFSTITSHVTRLKLFEKKTWASHRTRRTTSCTRTMKI